MSIPIIRTCTIGTATRDSRVQVAKDWALFVSELEPDLGSISRSLPRGERPVFASVAVSGTQSVAA